jgi:hypothetical protein
MVLHAQLTSCSPHKASFTDSTVSSKHTPHILDQVLPTSQCALRRKPRAVTSQSNSPCNDTYCSL